METLGTGAAQLNLLFQIGSSRSIYFNFNTDISAYTFEFVLKKNKGARVKILSLTLNSGITFPIYVSDQILVSFSVNDTSIEEGEYYWELRKSNSNICLLNGLAYFSWDSPSGSIDSSLSLTVENQTVNVTISNVSQNDIESVDYSTTFTFDFDKEIYKDLTGTNPTITLSSSNAKNGACIIFRANKPNGITFNGVNSEATSASEPLDSTKMNVYSMIYFSNWNNSGMPKVIYTNILLTAI